VSDSAGYGANAASFPMLFQSPKLDYAQSYHLWRGWMGKAIFSVEKIPAFVKSGVAVVGTFRFGMERSCDYPLFC
jgi:hypothetical protein